MAHFATTVDNAPNTAEKNNAFTERMTFSNANCEICFRRTHVIGHIML